MRKIIVCLFCALLLCSLTVPAFADIIWTPAPGESSFFDEHRQECTMDFGREYLTNSPQGQVEFYDEPGGSVKVTATNGTPVYVSIRYQDWGMVSEISEERLALLWVKMDDLMAIYNYEDFLDTHPLTEKPENLVWGALDGKFLIWTYPGSGEYQEISTGQMGGENEVKGMLEDTFIQGYYTDEDGLVYGFIGYMYGHRNGFICISDPMNPELKVDPVVQKLHPSAEEPNTVIEKKPSYLLPGILVCGAVVVSGGFLILLKKRKDNERG